MLLLSIGALTMSDLGVRWGCARGKFSCAFLPENALSISTQNAASGLSQQEYLDAISRIQRFYAPIFSRAGQQLIIQSAWNDDRVNSFATRDDNDNPVVIAPGGMARHPLMTSDGMLAVICHEVGHFLGGAPKIHRGDTDLLSWSSAEGEADYFAASKCLKDIFSNEQENETVIRTLPADRQTELAKKCDSYQCMRVIEAGQAITEVFAAVTAFSQPPNLETPDTAATQALVYAHPSPQCRLDTFVHGALCSVSSSVPFDDRDPSLGACTDPSGARPNCWFVTN